MEYLDFYNISLFIVRYNPEEIVVGYQYQVSRENV